LKFLPLNIQILHPFFNYVNTLFDKIEIKFEIIKAKSRFWRDFALSKVCWLDLGLPARGF